MVSQWCSTSWRDLTKTPLEAWIAIKASRRNDNWYFSRGVESHSHRDLHKKAKFLRVREKICWYFLFQFVGECCRDNWDQESYFSLKILFFCYFGRYLQFRETADPRKCKFGLLQKRGRAENCEIHPGWKKWFRTNFRILILKPVVNAKKLFEIR